MVSSVAYLQHHTFGTKVGLKTTWLTLRLPFEGCFSWSKVGKSLKRDWEAWVGAAFLLLLASFSIIMLCTIMFCGGMY